VIGSADSSSLIMKSIATDCYSLVSTCNSCSRPYSVCRSCLFLLQIVHFRTYSSTACRIFRKKYTFDIVYKSFAVLGCPRRGLLWNIYSTLSRSLTGTYINPSNIRRPCLSLKLGCSSGLARTIRANESWGSASLISAGSCIASYSDVATTLLT
jgi:hypothetical protein